MISIHHQVTARQFWLIAAGLLLLLVVGRIITQSVHAVSGESRSGRHVLTVHDNGHEVGLLTEADTLRQALNEANISLAANDITEPALDEELVAAAYEVNIYRSRPVTVIDGQAQTKVMTPYQTPKQIAKQAGVELRSEDRVTREYADDVLMAGSLERMIIDRATKVRLVFYGKTMTVYTHAETVADMLAERDIEPTSQDTISVGLAKSIRSGMTVEIWRNGKQTVTVDESVDFPTRHIEDGDRPVGYRKVKTAGVKGEKTVTYEVVMRNGRQVSKKAIKTVVTKKPQAQIEIIGVKLSLPPGSHQDWMRAAGISSGDFGYVNAIFSQESGWNPAAVNPSGQYYGLGQTNLDRLEGACGSNWASDPICQIKVFDTYANERYGSWKSAYEFKFGAPGKSGAGWW